MKKWYRNTIVKAILIGTVIVASILASLSGVLLIGYQGEGVVTSESILQFQKGAYKESEAFANRMRQVMYMVLDEMQAGLQLETSDGKYRSEASGRRYRIRREPYNIRKESIRTGIYAEGIDRMG